MRKPSFTGSPATGAAVLRTAADNLTPTWWNWAAHPLVIFEDANLDAAVAGAVEGGFVNQGEACTAASRLLAHRSAERSTAATAASTPPRPCGSSATARLSGCLPG
ncbi:aldehyde dehydrogenase family protein [Streptomyces sp. NPDC002403]